MKHLKVSTSNEQMKKRISMIVDIPFLIQWIERKTFLYLHAFFVSEAVEKEYTLGYVTRAIR